MHRCFVVLLIVASVLLSGCYHYVVNSHEETVSRNPRVLDNRVIYEADGVTLSNDTLHISLDRQCRREQEVDVQRIAVETRNYNATFAYIGIGTAATIGLSAALVVWMDADSDCLFEDGCSADANAQKDTAGSIALGTLGAVLLATGITIYFDVADFESETVLESSREVQTEQLACSSDWPVGEAVLVSSSAGRKFYGELTSRGQVDVNVSDAPREMWLANEPLELQLPGTRDWVSFMVPEPVRRAGLEQNGETLVSLRLRFDDEGSVEDGNLNPNESARIVYTITNDGDATVRDLTLDLVAEVGTGLDIESPVRLGNIGPGEVVEGEIDITATSVLSARTEVLDGALESAGVTLASDRMRLSLVTTSEARRIFVHVAQNKKHGDLLEAGSTRLQSVMTRGGRFKFASDDETQSRITHIVEKGGGSIEDRRVNAIKAARQENISSVFQLSATPIAGTEVQLVLAVYDTISGDRVFLRDAPADTNDAFQALAVFDDLANAYLEWEKNQ